MTALETRLHTARQQGRKVLVTYLCVGDPSLDETVELAVECAKAGADILELGVPFSDPTADGPVIARASQRALAKGGSLQAALEVAARVREKTAAPIVLFGYYNPVFVHGEIATAREAAKAGVDALLIVDLPLQEGAALRQEAKSHGLHVVPLLTPTSSAERVELLRQAHALAPVGFVYYVSVTGVTGSATAPLEVASEAAAQLERELQIPTVVGFGIDSGAKARAASAQCTGVVVGTALVKAIEAARSPKERVEAVTSLVSDLRRAIDTR